MVFNQEISYKEVCKQIGDEEINSGKGRKLQLDKWKESYDIEKVGRGKYIIYKKLSAKESQNNKDRKNYSKFLQATLLKFLSHSEHETTVYTYREIREHLAMVNLSYFPAKYDQQHIVLDMPNSLPDYLLEDLKQIWFNAADDHDEYSIKAALRKLNDKKFISLAEGHVVYKKVHSYTGAIVWSKPKLLSSIEEATFLQTGLDYLKKYNCKTTKDLYSCSEFIRQGYYIALTKYIKSLGYDRYAKAFIVTRATNLAKVVNYFLPDFNIAQVNRYLKSKRFKVLPPVMHEQMVKQFIEWKLDE